MTPITKPTMKKIIEQKLSPILTFLKPWLIAGVVLVLFKSTGILAGMSDMTHRALLSTGFLDAEVIASPTTDFNYEFEIRDLQGKNINVSSYKGKVIFFNMWATWCGPCRAEMSSIQQLYSKINNKNISFIMLSIDQRGQEQKVQNYVKSQQFTFPIFMPVNSVPEQLQVPSIPTTFIIGKDGKVVSKQVGSTNFDTPEFKKFLEGLASK